MRKNKTSLVILFILLFVLTGFLREFIFKSINYHMQSLYDGYEGYLPASLSFLQSFTYSELTTLKYVLTVIFFILFLILSVFCLKKLTANAYLVKACYFAYAGLLAVSALVMVFGFISGLGEGSYSFARFFMGLGQSPVIFMILYASHHIKLRNA